jgi:hypothetical protein
MRKDWESRRYRVVWLNLSTNHEMISGHNLTYTEAECLIRQGFWAKDSHPKILRVDDKRRVLKVAGI